MLGRPVKTDRKGLKADLACQVKKRPVPDRDSKEDRKIIANGNLWAEIMFFIVKHLIGSDFFLFLLIQGIKMILPILKCV